MSYRNRIPALALLFVMALPVCAQQNMPPVIPDASQGDNRGRREMPADRTFEELEREQQKKLNKKRQDDLSRDTQKLLDLATQLKEYVDKSNEHVLSLEVLKKAEEIEKLAKSVKEKMRGQ